MGIFSLFGKKNIQQTKPDDTDASRPKRNASSKRTGSSKGSSGTTAVKRDRDTQAALATALKIDAIESEMSSEFVNLKPAPQTGTKPAASRSKSVAKPRRQPDTESNAPLQAAAAAILQPLETTGTTTRMLLSGNSTVEEIAGLSSEAAAVIQEAAITYANGQLDQVEQMLCTAIDEDMLGEVTQKAWQMLFDLYQITGKQAEFDQLSLTYANKFETSPPAWNGAAHQDTVQAAPSGATPIVAFSGRLDAAAQRQIERVRKLAETQQVLRLEFGRVTEVDAVGCGLLLNLLKSLQKSGHELVLVGIAELAGRIRGIVEVGRRDDSEDAWLLLLELLRLLNREGEFEETSIDYCVTFEVSPPAFEAPQGGVTTAAETAEAPAEADCFPMPALIEGLRIDNLILAIAAYSDEHDLAVIDCSQLTRIDFNAAGRLLSGLSPFCGNGRQIEFHHVNHLVAELFDIIGLGEIARVLPRKS